MMLASLIIVPLAFALFIAVGPERSAARVSLVGMLATLGLSILAAFAFDWGFGGQFQFGMSVDWLPGLGLTLSLGVDSVALMLVLLTAVLGPVCVLASWTAITERVKTYYAWMMVLQAAMIGVFAARDLVFFYICFEFTLIPMFLLIALYGSTNRMRAATKFFLFTFTGSVVALAGLLYVAWHHAQTRGVWTFEIDALELAARTLPPHVQALILGALLLGFAVKVPLFPLHTWLPLAHTEAPTAGSVILAGVLLKLGTYAIYRFVLPFAPEAVIEYAYPLAVLCTIGIIYGGLVCWVQTDVKKLVAYSSVAHLGFCMLGMFALNHAGVTGSVLYMLNHGLSTGALFLLIGMMYERYHTRSMKEIGGLGARMPVWSTFLVFFVMASVGLPGLNGFVGEFLCLMGAFQASDAWGAGLWGTTPGDSTVGGTRGSLGPWVAAVAGTGMIIAAIYLLYMVGKVVFGTLREPPGHASHADHHAGDAHRAAGLPVDLTRREIGALAPIAALCVFLGVYPKPVLDAVQAPVERTVTTIAEARGKPKFRPPVELAPPAEHAAEGAHP
ncbi:MAG: NADH-quinone oxidoreductase subunit M [Phycisphaerae bacterium]|nr:NADH-quinone oxidoreductase subunit M [Phycisphaerae bacterium]